MKRVILVMASSLMFLGNLGYAQDSRDEKSHLLSLGGVAGSEGFGGELKYEYKQNDFGDYGVVLAAGNSGTHPMGSVRFDQTKLNVKKGELYYQTVGEVMRMTPEAYEFNLGALAGAAAFSTGSRESLDQPAVGHYSIVPHLGAVFPIGLKGQHDMSHLAAGVGIEVRQPLLKGLDLEVDAKALLLLTGVNADHTDTYNETDTTNERNVKNVTRKQQDGVGSLLYARAALTQKLGERAFVSAEAIADRYNSSFTSFDAAGAQDGQGTDNRTGFVGKLSAGFAF